MKIIEAMKRIKANIEKVDDLRAKIGQNSAHLNYETPPYGDQQTATVMGWVQSALDISQENARLGIAIQRTNLATPVTIEIGGKQVTKQIAEWVLRRRTYAELDLNTWSRLTDRGLKEGTVNPTMQGSDPVKVSIVRNYDPAQRDVNMAIYRLEPHLIDAALEIVNATTDLLE